MDLSQLRQTLNRLTKERTEYEKTIMKHNTLIKGSLVEQFKVCGKRACRCQRGEKHGPYYYLSNKIQGKTQLLPVTKERSKIKQKVLNYREFRKAREKWVKVNASMLHVIDQIEEAKKEAYPPDEE
jgi:hypothetical protein